MSADIFARHAEFLRSCSSSELAAEIAAPDRLRLAETRVGSKPLVTAWAPFEHVNPQARIVIVGLTPGRKQMGDALAEARRLLRAGASEVEAQAGAKVHASFAGPMRANLVAMLDQMGVASLLGLNSAGALWRHASHLAQFTSVLRNPVFVDGKNYSGAPHPVSTPFLFEQVRRWFAPEAARLRHALFVPLGPKVTEAVEAVADEAGLDRDRILSGLPHPSGANAERIAYFLGRKPREALSAKVAPDRLDAVRRDLDARIRRIGGAL